MLRLIRTMLGVKRRDFMIIKVLILGLFYFSLVSARIPGAKIPILLIFALTIFLYMIESKRTKAVSDSFEDDNLFFRYGNPVSKVTLPIKISETLTQEESDTLFSEMAENIKQSMREEVDNRIVRGKHSSEILHIKDNWKKDTREFLRFAYTGERGGALSNFVNFSYIGNYAVINFDSHMKGIAHWYDKLDFLFTSPLRIWFWLYSWIRGNFSIITDMSQYLDNSFEEYDIYAYKHVSHFTILESIRDFLKSKDLLTEELEGIIQMQLVYNNYGNQINVNGSNNTLGAVTQAAMKGAK